jgi:hypothetical protein
MKRIAVHFALPIYVVDTTDDVALIARDYEDTFSNEVGSVRLRERIAQNVGKVCGPTPENWGLIDWELDAIFISGLAPRIAFRQAIFHELGHFLAFNTLGDISEEKANLYAVALASGCGFAYLPDLRSRRGNLRNEKGSKRWINRRHD